MGILQKKSQNLLKIQYVSDLHLEFPENSKYFSSNPLPITGEILIIAGDAILLKEYKDHPFWDYCSKNYKETLIIPGNHEFYDGPDLSTFNNGMIIEIKPNVKYYYNYVYKPNDDVDIILTTLWSHIEEDKEKITEEYLNDFRKIKYKGHILTAKDFNEEHQKCLEFLKKSLSESKAKNKIVVSHHLPSKQLNNPEYMDSEANGGFVVNLEELIKSNKDIKYWIFGHSHYNVDKKIGKTFCVSNQFGYLLYHENDTFNPKKNITI